MDVTQARYFLAVAEELHFGRAAQRLHIAQPPLSRTIKALEKQLGATLFDRNTRIVRLTASGAALVGPARQLLDASRRAEEAVRAAEQGDVGRVRLSFAGVSTHRLVATVAREIRATRPGIELDLSSQNFAISAMRRLTDGDTDLVLGRWDAVPADVAAVVVQHDSLVVAVADTHRLAGARGVTFADLEGEHFITLPLHEGSVLTERVRTLARDAGYVAEIAQTAPDSMTALALVAAEVGCHLTLASVARNVADPHVVYVPVDPLDGAGHAAHATEAGRGEAIATDVHLRAIWRTADRNPALRVVLGVLRDVERARVGAPGREGDRSTGGPVDVSRNGPAERPGLRSP